jgi:hypothetical protein
MTIVHVYYRISQARERKSESRPDWWTWQVSMRNFAEKFSTDDDTPYEVTIVCDNVSDRMLEDISVLANEFFDVDHLHILRSTLGNSGSMKMVLRTACGTLSDDDIVYFVEDDYIHREDSIKAIVEGLEIADYVTLYDHPDKMQKNYPYPQPPLNLRTTASSHWRDTVSTCMTFASKVSTLQIDRGMMTRFMQQDIPNDHEMFTYLTNSGRTLVSPIPGFATHCMVREMAPCVDWFDVAGWFANA